MWTGLLRHSDTVDEDQRSTEEDQKKKLTTGICAAAQKRREEVITGFLNLLESPSVCVREQLSQPFWCHPDMESTEGAQVSFTKTIGDGTLIAVIDGK